MGKDLNGKEIGHGIIQKKNGRYEARYVDRFGKRRSVSGGRSGENISYGNTQNQNECQGDSYQ